MNKYIIEIEDVPFSKVRIDADNGAQNINLYRAKGFKSLVFDQFGLDKLTPLDKALSSELEEAYHKGFEAGSHEATTLEYQQGLDDAWECMKAIAFLNKPRDMRDFFGCSTLGDVLIDYTASEAIEKLKAYEEQQKADAEIKVGDEVCFVFAGGETIEPFIVFSIKDDNRKKYYEGIQTSDGRWVSGGLKYYKTGRHFPQVAELLEAMKEGAE